MHRQPGLEDFDKCLCNFINHFLLDQGEASVRLGGELEAGKVSWAQFASCIDRYGLFTALGTYHLVNVVMSLCVHLFGARQSDVRCSKPY